MCGIAVTITSGGATTTKDQASLAQDALTTQTLAALYNRGPDVAGHVDVDVGDGGDTSLKLYATVLHMRGGAQATPQPLQDAAGNVLVWNGEVFGGTVGVADGANDGVALFARLAALPSSSSSSSISPSSSSSSDVVDLLAGVEGPFAFAFWQRRTRTLYYGRDRLGRRSLLQTVQPSPSSSSSSSSSSLFMLASVAVLGVVPSHND
jgi:asparagine synthetase B (glutamine-hydrolysing)